MHVGDSRAMLYRVCDTMTEATELAMRGGAKVAQVQILSPLYCNSKYADSDQIKRRSSEASKLTATGVHLEAGEYIPLVETTSRMIQRS